MQPNLESFVGVACVLLSRKIHIASDAEQQANNFRKGFERHRTVLKRANEPWNDFIYRRWLIDEVLRRGMRLGYRRIERVYPNVSVNTFSFSCGKSRWTVVKA